MFYKKVWADRLAKLQQDIGEVDRELKISDKLRSREI